jgi:hypothetical protein
VKLKDFRITFESRSSIAEHATTEFTVSAKNYGDAEKKALSQFDKREKHSCIIIIEKLKKENKNV